MTFIKSDNWTPSSGITIEGRALEIVKAETSNSIIAGPGAGKTEILAQRANYLLTTGLCPPPQRILAISFKVDAARNIHDRVKSRCESSQARRFESLTLDAFAKRIVDQFREALPEKWRPTSDYTIIFPNHDLWENFRNRHGDAYPTLRGMTNPVLDRCVHGGAPFFEFDQGLPEQQKIIWQWWSDNIHSQTSSLTFDMIKILATHILGANIAIRSALQQTYSHVFLDEFQDVTTRQYALVQTAFLGSSAIMTAVGDSNQAIMRWAGAREDIFDRLEEDFGAVDQRLQFNYRSNSRIVQLINDLAATFDDQYIPTECARQNDPIPPHAVDGWVFNSRDDEGEYLASFIANELRNNDDLKPSDIVLLARIRINDVEDRLLNAFQLHGITIRNEARNAGKIAIQDLVKETAYNFLLSALKLAVNVRSGEPFQTCRDVIAEVRGTNINTDKGHTACLNAIRKLVSELEDLINNRTPDQVSGEELLGLILKHVEPRELKRAYREYAGAERLQHTIDGFAIFFNECRQGMSNWEDCIANIEGLDAVKLMTIHKSKGLEYHTVFFLEFNNDAFFGNDDDVNVFFVALSRAKERVIFSFTKDAKFGKVKSLLDRLTDAGVNYSEKRVEKSGTVL